MINDKVFNFIVSIDSVTIEECLSSLPYDIIAGVSAGIISGITDSYLIPLLKN